MDQEMLISEESMEFFNKPILEMNEKFNAHIEKLCKENPNGKIYYTAPEQVYDKRTDSWSWHYYAGLLPEEVSEEYLVKSILKKQTMIIDLSKSDK